MLSKDSHVVQNFSKFTLADYLIGLGGISRSFYLMGMVVATAASKLLYKQAMILSLFMWQRPVREKAAEPVGRKTATPKSRKSDKVDPQSDDEEYSHPPTPHEKKLSQAHSITPG